MVLQRQKLAILDKLPATILNIYRSKLMSVQQVVLLLTGRLRPLALMAYWLTRVWGSNGSLLLPLSGVIYKAATEGISITLCTLPRKN